MHITQHSERRVRERLGIPKRAIERMAAKALAEGLTHSDFSGRMKRYLDSVFFEHKTANNMRVYNQHLFIFNNDTLITAWPLPPQYRKAALRTK